MVPAIYGFGILLGEQSQAQAAGCAATCQAYNLIGICLAAAELLEPWPAALVMLVYSLFVAYRDIRTARPA